MKIKRSKIYVGVVKSGNTKIIPNTRVVFKWADEVTKTTHPFYVYVIGPFRTMRAARFCAKYPYSGCNSVAEFERVTLAHVTQSELIADYAKKLTGQ